MGYLELKRDVEAAALAEEAHISHVRRGDVEAEFTFIYSHRRLIFPLKITALALTAESYPATEFIISTKSRDVPAELEPLIANLPEMVKGKTAWDLMMSISRSITIQLDNRPLVVDDVLGLTDDDSDDSEFDTGYHDYEDQLPRAYEPIPNLPSHSRITKLSQESRQRLKQHLKKTIQAGIRPVLLGESYANCNSIFALPLRVKALKLPEDVLDAWDLDVTEYIILLVRLNGCYPTLDQVLQQPSTSQVQFRLGKCKTSEPSLISAKAVFEDSYDASRKNPRGPLPRAKETTKSTATDDFRTTYICDTINDLLQKHLPALIRLRRDRNLSWDQAQESLLSKERGQGNSPNDLRVGLQVQKANADRTPVVSRTLSPALERDFMTDRDEDFNLLLVALQLALQRLLNCTAFCMVCHRKVQSGYEAVKPYVCDEPLCLHQYLNLGFVHTVEHEVIKHPYVVDLLISFFAAAIVSSPRTAVPTALGIKMIDRQKRFVAFKNSDRRQVSLQQSGQDPARGFTIGALFAMLPGTLEIWTQSSTAPSATSIMPQVCRIDSKVGDTITYSVLGKYNNSLLPKSGTSRKEQDPLAQGPQQVLIWLINKDIDGSSGSLDDAARIGLISALNCIPSVLEMRSYLQEEPGRQLRHWWRMDRSTHALLNWIIKSNRSYLVHDDIIPGATYAPHMENAVIQRKITGLGNGWMQFRFQQGCPEKEQRFDLALEELNVKNNIADYKALFAWHGSGVSNWHSIIREGLDFRDTRNGRSFGNGVYLSQNMVTSSGYSAQSAPVWENSILNPNSALALCELVNNPAQFVSAFPHLVVSKTDWIQCRYLLVRVEPKPEAQRSPLPLQTRFGTQGYIEQDSSRQLMNGPWRCNIPKLTITTSVSARSGLKRIINEDAITKALSRCGLNDDEATSSSDAPVLGKRRRKSDASPASRASKRNRIEPSSIADTSILQTGLSASTKPAVTAFTPGLLDWTALSILPEPSWVSSSHAALRRLSRDVREMQAMQATTTPAELGWYLDFEKMENLFQWIVELHSFPRELPLAKDMEKAGCQSIVLEVRFGSSYPASPPFVRVIRPTFLPFRMGGGGHVTEGGAICSELLTNSGWMPILSFDKVLLTVRLGLMDEERPARLTSDLTGQSYSAHEAVEAYRRAASAHGWQIPKDFDNFLLM